MTSTAFGYTRVSTREQAVSGLGLEAQEKRIRSYCALKGLDLTTIHSDPGESGSRPLASRPGGAALLADVRGGPCHVVIAKLDRAWRSASDCLATLDTWRALPGVHLHLLDLGIDTGTPMGAFFLTVAAAFAELERRLISERTRVALAEARAQGKKLGGFRQGKVDPVAIGRLYQLKGTSREVANTLNDEGFRTAVGSRWTPGLVRKWRSRRNS